MGAKVIPFARPVDPLAYDPGTVPFDRMNPDHIRVWNTIAALGRSELRFCEMELAEREREGR